MQTIPKNALTHFETAMLRPAELCLWAGVIFAVCLSAVIGHGRSRESADVRVQLSDAAGGTQPVVDTTTWRLDVNSASAHELEMLPGIGVRRAKAIVQERQKRGGFTSVWELCDIPGLTRPLVQRIEPLLQVKPPALPAR